MPVLVLILTPLLLWEIAGNIKNTFHEISEFPFPFLSYSLWFPWIYLAQIFKQIDV